MKPKTAAQRFWQAYEAHLFFVGTSQKNGHTRCAQIHDKAARRALKHYWMAVEREVETTTLAQLCGFEW